MTTAIFVTAASPHTGGGHVLRCLALAESLARQGLAALFAVDTLTLETVGLLRDGPFDIVTTRHDEAPAIGPARDAEVVIFDSYDLDRTFESRWRRAGRIRVAIDDLANRAHDCELLVDPSPGRLEADYAALVPGGCSVLSGPSFALLRAEFQRCRSRALERRSAAPVRRLLVAMGLTDVGGVTRRAVEAVLMADLGIAIDAVAGRGAASLPWLRGAARSAALDVHVDLNGAAMAELMAAADIAIGGAGGTSLERCCLGLPSLVILLADNQQRSAEALERAGAAWLVGDVASATPRRIASVLTTIAHQADERERCSKAAAALVDGAGADRVARAIIGRLGAAR